MFIFAVTDDGLAAEAGLTIKNHNLNRNKILNKAE